jgi:YggT family protein
MLNLIVNFINTLALLLSIIMIAYVLSTWVFPPYHSFRNFIAAIAEPLLAPIHRVVPPVGGLDFSPFIFMILVDVAAAIVTGFVH